MAKRCDMTISPPGGTLCDPVPCNKQCQALKAAPCTCKCVLSDACDCTYTCAWFEYGV